jgi:hypothetical protein
MAVALTSTGQQREPTGDAAAYERALYPQGVPQRHNAIANATEKPEFVFAADAVLPGTNRSIVVYAERLSRDLPFDKIYTVYVAVVERGEKGLAVLGRDNVTEEIEVFTAFPGNFLEVRAQVIPLPTGKPMIVAVELWAIIDGTGSISKATHLFYAINRDGKLERVLDLDATYASGRSGAVTSSKISTVAVAPDADGVADLLVRSRAVTWTNDEDDAAPQCGPVSLSRYRFDGTKFREMDVASGLPDNAFVLPRLDVEETDTCDNPVPESASETSPG